MGDESAKVKAPPEVRVWLPKQSIDAEEQKKVHYLISLSWCYNEIEYGLLKGGWEKGVNVIPVTNCMDQGNSSSINRDRGM